MTAPREATDGGAVIAAERELAVHRRLMRFGEAESRVAPVWLERNTTIPRVAAHLARLWTLAGEEGTAVVTEKGLPHARASVLNLIVTVADAAAAERVVETMLGLGFRHPSRAIVLVADPTAAEASIDASVSAHCHPTTDGGGAGDQVCYEEVILTVRGAPAAHLGGVVAPLLIHDLPTEVWWPGPPPFADPVFDQLLEIADRLVIDSSDFGDLLPGLRRLTSLRHRCGVGDLAWKRLGWWMELTAQFFDAPRFRRYLPNLNRVEVRYALPLERPAPGTASPGTASPGTASPGTASPGTASPRAGLPGAAPGIASPLAGAILYAGWIASRLDWKRHATAAPLRDGRLELGLEGRYAMIDLVLEGVPTAELPPGELLHVSLRARGETGAAEFIIDRERSEATVASNADGMTAQLRRVHMDPPSESELLAETLTLGGEHDEVYEAALRAAAVFLAAARPPTAAR